MQCPNCNAPLSTVEYEGIRIETCNECGGEWLDAEELKHVNRAREVKFSPEQRQAIVQATGIRGVKLADVDRDLRCPKCAGQTDPVNYGGDTGIIIDRCSSCDGIWLDASELEKVQQLVEGWADALEGDLAKYGPKLREVAAEVEGSTKFSHSRSGFINAIINGILDLSGH